MGKYVQNKYYYFLMLFFDLNCSKLYKGENSTFQNGTTRAILKDIIE